VVAGPARPAPAAGPPALELRSVSRSFEGLRAVNDVSFALAPGERVAVLGPNGAGKTTLFNLISGTLRVSAGAIRLFGEDVTAAPPHRRTARGLARTFQVTTLFPALSVADNVRLALLGLGSRKLAMLRPVEALDEVTERVEALLDRFDLGSRRAAAVRELSHGEQRMLEILLAVASGPRVLLLDEPTSGVAAGEVEPIVRMVRELDPGMTVLIIEHDMDVAFRLAGRILVLHYGQLLRSGTPEAIRLDPLVAEIYLGTA
jgi:branched-chain amino acid transport system ATP-binding protein